MRSAVLNLALVVFIPECVFGAASYIVHSPWGSIQGVPRAGGSYVTYFNIPYAKPPVGNLRFEHPFPHPRPIGVHRTSSAHGNICPQANSRSPSAQTQSEDCLTLNVFTPGKVFRAPRAVVVWIHGGGWLGGSAAYFDMWKMVTQADVIGVTIQYRLGVLGFLSTGSKTIPGNYAMMDQVLALKWVKDNIASFGGDANNITLYGQSAGAASVGFHTLSPVSKGLFNRAILQSGTALAYWATRSDTKKYSLMLARRLNCAVTTTGLERPDTDIITCLRNISFRTIVDNGYFDLPVAAFVTDIIWSPVVDHHFLVGDPQKLIRDASFLQSVGFYDIDIMLGVNNADGGYSLTMANMYGHQHKTSGIDIISSHDFLVNEFLPTMLSRVYGRAPKVEIDVLSFESLDYESDQSPYPTLNQSAVAFLGQMRDIMFLVPAIRTARAHAARPGAGTTYVYYFDHYPTFANGSVNTGMDHSTDIGYAYGLSERYINAVYHTTGKLNQAEYDLSNTFVQLLASYAKTGNPNAALKNKLPSTWPDYSDNESYLSLSFNMAVKDHIRRMEVALWVDLIPKLNEDLRHSEIGPDVHHVPVIG